MKRFIQATPFLPIRAWLLLPLLAQEWLPPSISMNCFGLRVMLLYIGEACELTRAIESFSHAKINVGTVTVHGNPPCTISIDGQIRGQTPVTRAVLSVGEHRVICRTPTGALRSRNVSINAGSDTVVEFAQ